MNGELCACGQVSTTYSKTCKGCRERYKRARRQRKEAHIWSVHSFHEQQHYNNQTSRELFESTIRNRFVYAIPLDYDLFPAVSGYVVAFKPGLVATILESSGKLTDVPMDRIRSDPTPRKNYDHRASC